MGFFDSLIATGLDVVSGTVRTVGSAVEDVASLDVTLSNTRESIGDTAERVGRDVGNTVSSAVKLDL